VSIFSFEPHLYWPESPTEEEFQIKKKCCLIGVWFPQTFYPTNSLTQTIGLFWKEDLTRIRTGLISEWLADLVTVRQMIKWTAWSSRRSIKGYSSAHHLFYWDFPDQFDHLFYWDFPDQFDHHLVMCFDVYAKAAYAPEICCPSEHG
jgi:hypothetical protein